MVVFIIMNEGDVIGVANNKENALMSVCVTWDKQHIRTIRDTLHSVLLEIREPAKIGEHEGRFVTAVEIIASIVIEKGEHL